MKHYTTKTTKLLADRFTPVLIYASLNEKFSPCLLLESADYHTKDDSYSIICCDALENFIVTEPNEQASKQLSEFIHDISVLDADDIAQRFNSVFGFSAYEAVQCFETLKFSADKQPDLPLLNYQFFRFILVFEHYTETLYLIENIPHGELAKGKGLLSYIESHRPNLKKPFTRIGERHSNMTDAEYEASVSRGKEHCQLGDVFQIVPSRQFSQSFDGDPFIVYRSLRAINPSPFSFYFNYGEFQIFGASPEAQLLVRNGLAEIHPIAGTYKRTGNDEADAKEAAKLADDPKENSEHIMLVDLARNDLGKSAENIEVATYREIQFYSHVIHMVSKVTGKLPAQADSKQLFADTFPAGTLSGAPKYRAMELINELEPSPRGIYGGAIGAFGLNGDVNHAIAIRTMIAKNGKLQYQAGAGVVIDSVEEAERKEVFHKLKALETAMEKAEQLNAS